MKLPNYKKITSGDYASCWFCGKDTHYCLFERDGSESWSCQQHALKYSKNAKFQRLVKKTLQKQLSLISDKKSRVKNEKVGILNHKSRSNC